jgi:small subunit ribosomal protein S17
MTDEVRQSTRKVKKGVVLSNKMQKTVVVRVERTCRHPRYSKVITRAKKYYAHDESGLLQVGDQVTIMETRPLSKLKHWRVV